MYLQFKYVFELYFNIPTPCKYIIYMSLHNKCITINYT